MAHTQFVALYYIPAIVLIGLEAIRDFPKITTKSVALAVLASLLFGLLFATSFNAAWLFALTCLIALLIGYARDLVDFASRNVKPLFVLGSSALAGLLIGLVPFVLIYTPVLKYLPRRTPFEYLILAPSLIDIVKAPHGNLVWGWFTAFLPGGGTLSVTQGMTLIVLVLASRAIWTSSRSDRTAFAPTFALVALGVWLFSWLLTVRFNGFSIFPNLYSLIPGANAIRLGVRIQLFVNFWIVYALAILLEDWLRRSSAASNLWTRQAIVAGILLFCLFEQINTRWRPGLAREHELARLDQVPSPPRECRAFLVVPPSEPEPLLVNAAQNDAMWIAMKTGLPTLNGVSGHAPPNWKLAFWPNVDPLAEAHAWIKLAKMTEQICIYDREKRHWAPFGQTGIR